VSRAKTAPDVMLTPPATSQGGVKVALEPLVKSSSIVSFLSQGFTCCAQWKTATASSSAHGLIFCLSPQGTTYDDTSALSPVLEMLHC